MNKRDPSNMKGSISHESSLKPEVSQSSMRRNIEFQQPNPDEQESSSYQFNEKDNSILEKEEDSLQREDQRLS